MRIEANEMIVGFPARQVRRLMRETLGREISVRWVTKILQCAEAVAERVLAELEREGLVQHVDGHLEPSLRGSALAQATAARPLLRCTADRLVAEVVSRAALVNLDEDYAFRVRMLVVFGSSLGGAERLNDVDVACQLVPRWSGEQQEEAETFSRGIHESPFRNVGEWATWPKLARSSRLRCRVSG